MDGRGLVRRVLPWLALLVLVSCSETPTQVVVEQSTTVVDATLISASWPLQYVDKEVRAPFESDPLWQELVLRRNIRAAVELAHVDRPATAARVHSDAAGLFDVAALLSAHALIGTYGASRQKTDPSDVDHLLMVSYAIVGDLDKAREYANLPHSPLVEVWSKPWVSWLKSEKSWPPDLSNLPIELPTLAVGVWPDLSASFPSYELPELGVTGTAVAFADPSILLAVAQWHKSVALGASVDPTHVKLHGAKYQLPVESPVEEKGNLPMQMLFGSDFLHPGDGVFLADVLEHGSSAVSGHTQSSLLAALLSTCLVDGKISHEEVLDASREFSKTMRRSLAEAEGSEQDWHLIFADIASVSLLRTGALIAEADGDRETSGILQINAMERSKRHTGDSVALLSLAAWQVSNRATHKAMDILYFMIKRYPTLKASRYSLNALSLRVSRQSAGQGVGM
jgi:hypothetical protein